MTFGLGQFGVSILDRHCVHKLKCTIFIAQKSYRICRVQIWSELGQAENFLITPGPRIDMVIVINIIIFSVIVMNLPGTLCNLCTLSIVGPAPSTVSQWFVCVLSVWSNIFRWSLRCLRHIIISLEIWFFQLRLLVTEQYWICTINSGRSRILRG